MSDLATRRVAFVGLGTMGHPMASALLRAGHHVTVVRHRSHQAAATLQREGAFVAESPAEAARDADFLITMLPTEAHVNEVIFGEDGAASSMGVGGLVIDMSTIGPQAARDIGIRLGANGLSFLDSPVSGGPGKAEAGALTAIVGGDTSDLASAEPVLRGMASQIFHAGPTGAGQTAKACNNLLVAACMLANVEALSLGAASGIAPERLREIILASSGNNWQLENIVPVTILRNDYTPIFSLSLLNKDLAIAAGMARESGASFFVGGLAGELYKLAMSRDGANRDFSSVAHIYEMAFDGQSLIDLPN